ncbi:MAG: AAA family ATPase [Planctomycetaceae bacterium]|nr:AAA family ATPase [Planctomycetaceae bacterium]
MDEQTEKSKDLVQLARLAMAGRPQDVQIYITRMARKYQKLVPELGEQLKDLLKSSPTRQSPLRNAAMPTIPLDRDTHLHLLRVETSVSLEHEPIWQDEVAEALNQIVLEHRHADSLYSEDLAPTRTAIFTGPPGVGKTLGARWLARELERPLLTLDLSAVMSSYLGRTGSNVRHVLDYAKGVPCVLLLDELDAIAKRRDDDQELGELKRLVTVLLQEIDDWPAGGLLVAASNHQELLDPAVWRRFEVQVEFDLPSPQAVQQALKLFVDDNAALDETWITALSEVLAGESFSDIERQIKLLRRQAVLSNRSLPELFPLLIRQHIESCPKGLKKEIALRLSQAGLSQRAINELTGLSRDTLRKLNHAEHE